MKTIQSLLAKAKPPARTIDFDDLVTFYMAPGSAYHNTIMQKIATLVPNRALLMRSWETQCYLLGLVYRMHHDGQDPFPKLGLTQTEAYSILAAFNLLRNKILGADTTTNGSPTKKLYDTITNLG